MHCVRQLLIHFLYIDGLDTILYIVPSDTVNEFNLYSRALHVFQEAKRVMEFKEICDSKQPDPEKITNLGILMNASHDSCRDLYDCSCPELDEMVDIAR